MCKVAYVADIFCHINRLNGNMQWKNKEKEEYADFKRQNYQIIKKTQNMEITNRKEKSSVVSSDIPGRSTPDVASEVIKKKCERLL